MFTVSWKVFSIWTNDLKKFEKTFDKKEKAEDFKIKLKESAKLLCTYLEIENP